MKLQKAIPTKTKAQAMVEFALVLPILLLLLYGLLEAGRLLFIYSTIVTGSRQAVRYGSATGEGTGAVPRYQDCTGIRQAAQRVDFLNAFNDDDILIQYDTGPGSTKTTFCDGSANQFNPTNNSFRLIVTIDGDYLPIVPKIVGFIERSDANNKAIKSESARTVLVSVPIQVTIPPSTYLPNTPTHTPSKTPTATFTPSNTPTNTLTPTVVFTNTATLTPTRTLTPTITLTPTVTSTPTMSLTPTLTLAPVACSGLTHGPIVLNGTTQMTMTITNPYPYAIAIKDVTVTWDHDKGHKQGGQEDKDLHLLSASLGGVFWTGDDDGASLTITPNPARTLPSGTSTIIFTFHQTYDASDKSEEIFITFSTPGCELYPIHATRK